MATDADLLSELLAAHLAFVDLDRVVSGEDAAADTADYFESLLDAVGAGFRRAAQRLDRLCR